MALEVAVGGRLEGGGVHARVALAARSTGDSERNARETTGGVR